MKKLVSALKSDTAFRKFQSDVYLLKQKVLFLEKNDNNFSRFWRYINKYRLDHCTEMTEVEELELLDELTNTYVLAMEILKKKNIQLDTYLLAKLIIQNHRNIERLIEILEHLNDDVYLEKGFRKEDTEYSLEEILIDEERGILKQKLKPFSKAQHLNGRNYFMHKNINSVRISEKLYKVLEILTDFNVSTLVSNLFIKHNIDEINIKEVYEFNKKLKDKFPSFFQEKKNRSFTLFLPAYFKYKIYTKNINIKKYKNSERDLVNINGLLWYILLKKEYPNVLLQLL